MHEVAGSWALAGSECYGDRMLAPISMVDAARARGDVHARMQVSPLRVAENGTSDNHCAIDRWISVQWHGVEQFLASRSMHGAFKQTGLR
jgi:hypothetical protein